MMIRLFCTLVVVLFAASSVHGQDKYVSPVNFAITLAGNVGEIRTDHFHTGIDIKALKGSGSPIYAVADGVVSRVGVSPWGYGNVLYVTHADGAVSVYAHLEGFVPEITKWVRSQQLAKKSFTVDLYPGKLFPVKQGQQIARLGNSGSSGGAHLHFEIREPNSGCPLNLIAAGIYHVPDREKPTLRSIKLYELDTVDGVVLHRLKQSVTPSDTATLRLRSVGYLAYEVIDYKDGKSNTMGIYSIEQQVDGVTNFSFAIDKVDFGTGKYMNSFTAYAENQASKIDVLRAYVSENNQLKIYKNIVNRGVISAGKDTIGVRAVIADDVGNQRITSFKIIRDTTSRQQATPGNTLAVRWNKPFNHSESKMAVTITQGSLFDDARLEFSEQNGIYTIGSRDVPLYKPMWVSLSIPDDMTGGSMGIVSVGRDGKIVAWNGGTYKNGRITASLKRFGDYKIAQDTIKPRISALSLGEKGGKLLKFKLSDNLSGVSDYSMTINGEWVLAEYDGKTATLSYRFSRNKIAVNHDVVVVVTDACNNSSTFKKRVQW